MTNRFKGLDLIDRVPENLWTEVCDSVQEAVMKTIPKERNAKKQNGCLRRPQGVGNGQGGLVCCDSWGHKESDTTEQLI